MSQDKNNANNPPPSLDQLQVENQMLRNQLELAKRDLEKLERMKPLASVASSVVHDIRNSLGIISSTAQFVLSKLNPADRERQAWELVDRNVESIKKILKGYLGIARQVENSKEYYVLNELVLRVIQFVENQTRQQNIAVEKDLDASVPSLQMDVPAVESALLNIAINAIEAMERDGSLRFSTRRDEAAQQVVVTIQDSGPGIPPELMEKIFTPFFTTKKTGTGMGLYSAKAAVEQSNGKFMVESKPGQGTKMILTFPITPPAAIKSA